MPGTISFVARFIFCYDKIKWEVSDVEVENSHQLIEIARKGGFGVIIMGVVVRFAMTLFKYLDEIMKAVMPAIPKAIEAFPKYVQQYLDNQKRHAKATTELNATMKELMEMMKDRKGLWRK
tara:strand:- start:26 stop:388 length:363 start_codon:yes stop_codon:yes gene_type:complete